MDGTPGVVGSRANMKTNNNKNERNGNQNVIRNHHKSVMRWESTNGWWARSTPAQRALAKEIATLIEGVVENKRLEIRKERGGIAGGRGRGARQRSSVSCFRCRCAWPEFTLAVP
jgi:hypothetical protein